MSTAKWESIIDESTSGVLETTVRTKVPGGWLVKTIAGYSEHMATALVFVPDPKHEWKINSDKNNN